MVEVAVTTKRWGSSIGVVIPKSVIDEQHIQEGEEIVLDIKKRHKAKEFFGLLRGWKASAQDLKDEARKGWD